MLRGLEMYIKKNRWRYFEEKRSLGAYESEIHERSPITKCLDIEKSIYIQPSRNVDLDRSKGLNKRIKNIGEQVATDLLNLSNS